MCEALTRGNLFLVLQYTACLMYECIDSEISHISAICVLHRVHMVQ
jgi:hypothetical protein